ncbi:hypothetical protein C2L64_51765 [Paraburkholderia hospita]|uniref:Uncharacterized protein n=1 Tax=Paraburkholderia hospita TaxID=169430 RepID=A0AAN1JM74_9BURK|nr:hypothetical protein C2L64_51765 [Paraburkholderia hospita]OUL86884.1 hypothetical protein CA603_21935 [Paraburkholderia hospita]
MRFVARNVEIPCAAQLFWLGVADPSRAWSFFEAAQRFGSLMRVVLPAERPGVFVNRLAIRFVIPNGLAGVLASSAIGVFRPTGGDMDDGYYWVLLIFLTLVLLFGLVSALSDLVNDERAIVRPPERPSQKATLRTPSMTACVQRMRGASERHGRGHAKLDVGPRIGQRRRLKCPMGVSR